MGALVINADLCVSLLAVFVLCAFYTATLGTTIFARGAIFVGATDALVVLCTLLGGACVVLTVGVLQTSNTETFGRAAIQQTTFRTVFTPWDRDADLSAASEDRATKQGQKKKEASSHF